MLCCALIHSDEGIALLQLMRHWPRYLCYCSALNSHVQVDVNTEVGVIHDYALRELRLFTDYGRTSRPLFIVDDKNQLVFNRRHLKLLMDR